MGYVNIIRSINALPLHHTKACKVGTSVSLERRGKEIKKVKWLPTFFFFLSFLEQPYLFSTYMPETGQTSDRTEILIPLSPVVHAATCSPSLINWPALLSVHKHLRMCKEMLEVQLRQQAIEVIYFIYSCALDSSAIQYNEKMKLAWIFPLILNKTQRPMATIG